MTIEVIPRKWILNAFEPYTLYLIGTYILFHPDAKEILHQQIADAKGWGFNERAGEE